MKNSNQSFGTIARIPFSKNPRAPHADITNAKTLFGDPNDFGDADGYGFASQASNYGDIEDGDPDVVAMFHEISGDVETGSPLGRVRNFAQKHKYATGAAAGVAGTLLTQKLIHQAKKIVAARRRRHAAMAKTSSRNYNRNVSQYAASAGKIARHDKIPFINVLGARITQTPISAGSYMPAETLKQMLDRQNIDTPFYQQTTTATVAVGGAATTATLTGVASGQFYSPLSLRIGSNQLQAAPGTVLTITFVMPTINGVTPSFSQPIVITMDNKFDVTILIYPWYLVANTVLPLLGKYDNTSVISATVTGAAANSVITLTAFGSLHPWVIQMRASLLK